MKLSNVVHYMATFGISAVGILTVAGILSLAERNLHSTPANAVEEVHDITADHLQASSQHPQSFLRSGYIGDFGYTSSPTASVHDGPAYRLPEVVERKALPGSEAQVVLAVPAPSPSAPKVKPIKRPTAQVGLFEVESGEVVSVSVNRKAKIVLGNGTVALPQLRKNDVVDIAYDVETGVYSVQQGAWAIETDQFVRVVPKKPHSVFTVHSYENRPAWNPALNDNQFFGKFELQYAPVTGKIWGINHLGIENYVKGIAEAGNDNDQAYLKALMTAARTYVYTVGDKYPDEPYNLGTTANDQVYKGYGITQRAPNVVEAVEATRGRVVHYKGVPAITPYFSITDGRTRSWEEVWNGSKEYLVSKPDPCCDGESLLGHGVGMSATGARYFAEQENWGWKKILKYYYTGITVPKVW